MPNNLVFASKTEWLVKFPSHDVFVLFCFNIMQACGCTILITSVLLRDMPIKNSLRSILLFCWYTYIY